MNLGFWIFRFSVCWFSRLFSPNIFWQICRSDIEEQIIKVFWRDPGQNGGFWEPFLVHWDSNLPSDVKKWTFWRHVRPNPAKVREKSFVCSMRSSRTPLDLPNFNLNYQKTSFCVKLDFSRFTNRSLVLCCIDTFGLGGGPLGPSWPEKSLLCI